MNNCTVNKLGAESLKELPQNGRTDFSQIFRALPFMKAFGFIPLSARSILLDSAFKVT